MTQGLCEYLAFFLYQIKSIPTESKQSIRISRGIGQAELFDPMPSQFEEDFLVTLLCHGDSIVDWVYVYIDDYSDNDDMAGDCRTHPLDAYRWFPRSLFKTLLLVRGIILTNIF